MKQKFSKQTLYIAIIIFFIIAILPVIVLIIKLGNQNISDDISDWSDFGGFLSGTTNTIISIFSLIILAYLTYFVGQQSSQENKNVNLLLRKLDAYDALASHMPRFNAFIFVFTRLAINLLQELNSGIIKTDLPDKKEKVIDEISYMNELYTFLYSFSNRYGHLFEYDFSCKNHQKLMTDAEELHNSYQKFASDLQTQEPIKNVLSIEAHENLSTGIKVLMMELRNEIEKEMK